ncbi:MAG: hypothetical protein KAW17_00960 [Candidatus Eisenbacteria sp.]|nr:hypothetical protein [Candidatus Eisenbacteria bacterium]
MIDMNALLREDPGLERSVDGLLKWFEVHLAEYLEHFRNRREEAKSLVPFFLELGGSARHFGENDLDKLIVKSVRLLEDSFGKQPQHFRDNCQHIVEDLHAAKWKFRDYQAIVRTQDLDPLNDRQRCLWLLALYHQLAEGCFKHLVIALQTAIVLADGGEVSLLDRIRGRDPKKIVKLLVRERPGLDILKDVYSPQLRAGFAHMLYERSRSRGGVVLKAGKKPMEVQRSELELHFWKLFAAVHALGLAIDLFLTRREAELDLPGTKIMCDPEDYIAQLRMRLATRGILLEITSFPLADPSAEIEAKASPVRQMTSDEFEELVKRSYHEIVCYLDHAAGKQTKALGLELRGFAGNPIGRIDLDESKIEQFRTGGKEEEDCS